MSSRETKAKVIVSLFLATLRFHRKCLIRKYLTDKSFKLKDLASIVAKSFIPKDRGTRGLEY
jgi:hypothetical protein